MAAQSVVLRSYDDPVETYSTNVLGTVHLLEAVRRMRGACTVINVTTDKCYENKGQVKGYREGDALGGTIPIQTVKRVLNWWATLTASLFFPLSRRNEHGVGLASARAGNVIGGGDWTTATCPRHNRGVCAIPTRGVAPSAGGASVAARIGLPRRIRDAC